MTCGLRKVFYSLRGRDNVQQIFHCKIQTQTKIEREKNRIPPKNEVIHVGCGTLISYVNYYYVVVVFFFLM